MSEDVRRIRYAAMDRLSQLRRQRDRLLEPHMVAVKLFLDGATGRFREGATEWLERLGRENFVHGRSPVVAGDHDRTMMNLGRQELAQEIFGRMLTDGERLEELNMEIRELEHGGR